MNVDKIIKLNNKYGICSKCGNKYIGNGQGGIYNDEYKFVRWCKCGFKVTVFEDGKEITERTNISQLDKKVNEDETLRDFIKTSHKEFYETELTDEYIDSLDEIKLSILVDYLDDLWLK
ncbi:DUF3797 domain-containing protein [Anaerosalibacter massiliensis]|uniref:DUF3797 domain-containing protein n=1 Tax=Anaerosalibacter massiliensis TaxID=1347392 RepID=A0A9X2MM04_9FIRM|nr:DUF3797 domain-containing protein [Anaerosalibacter massiliensis]MCR2045505.1 DUF3797 domain-containing protein [Anaerosalibacter massiliensis]